MGWADAEAFNAAVVVVPGRKVRALEKSGIITPRATGQEEAQYDLTDAAKRKIIDGSIVVVHTMLKTSGERTRGT